MPMLFNANRKDQFVKLTTSAVLNPTEACTFEAVCTLCEPGQDPSVFSRPISPDWRPPFAVYRLGFRGKTCRPEFQLLFENETELTTIVAEEPVETGRPTHVAGTYDGAEMKLYVDGALVAACNKRGRLQSSDQHSVLATRSSTDLGGMLVGTLQEIRMWRVARSSQEIGEWMNRLLPQELITDDVVGLWEGEPGPPDDVMPLRDKGFSDTELMLIHFVYWYAGQYNSNSPRLLQERVRERYGDEIKAVSFYKARDGYVTLYYPHYLVPDAHKEPDSEDVELFVFDRTGEDVTELIQDWTANKVRVAKPPIGKSPTDEWTLPADIENASAATVNPELSESSTRLPTLSISPKVMVENGRITTTIPERIRAISPLMESPSDGSMMRLFSWSFADLWLGGLTRELLHLPNTVQFLHADTQVLQWCIDLALPPQQLVDDGPTQTLNALRSLVEEFETLLDRPDVDEVRDIQPFLTQRRNWVLLSPTCKHVWPEKRLGNKWRVDFVVRESDDTYTAVEIESPKFPLFTKSLDPHHKLTHAEQQVRDYCEYVDRNSDSVAREENLPRIYRPKGVVVIGRRSSLNSNTMRKLVARNADAGRYTVMVYDDLLDKTRALIDSVAALI